MVGIAKFSSSWQVGSWVSSGAIRHREDIVIGLENAPQAFAGLLEGRNFGKLIIQVSEIN